MVQWLRRSQPRYSPESEWPDVGIRQTLKPGTELHLLAYVFVHETAHILQGINRHSDFGIRKARWGDDDYFQMRGSLAFTPTDVNLILAG